MKLISIVNDGALAPDFKGKDIDGNDVRLSSYWKEKPVVAVFLRHLGCTFCRYYVLQLRKEYELFQKAGAEVVCIAMGEPVNGKVFKVMFDLPFPMIMTGNDTSIYAGYSLGKGTFGQLFGPRMIVQGIKAMFTLGAKTHGGLQGDGFQMPGTFIIDKSGTIRLTYRSKDAADNPPNKMLLNKLNELHGGNRIELETNPVRPANAV